MFKMTRLAALAAVLSLASALMAVPQTAQAQAQPAAPAATATPAAPPPPPAPAAPTKTTELIENPYGLEALWKGGDIVARITLGILVIMSMGSWYIIITKVYEQSKMRKQARAAEKTFWNAPRSGAGRKE